MLKGDKLKFRFAKSAVDRVHARAAFENYFA